MAPAEALEAAQHDARGVSIATVYRTLKALCEDGWLVRVEVPGRGAYYERADRDHHHHFLCRDCDRLYEVKGCPGNVDEVAPDGCVVEEHDLLLHGVCADCRQDEGTHGSPHDAADAPSSGGP
jgi:Fur family ferric uptake transcriptional regulator